MTLGHARRHVLAGERDHRRHRHGHPRAGLAVAVTAMPALHITLGTIRKALFE
jgi:hypothetical protein